MKIIGMAGKDVIAQLTESDIAALVGEGYFDSKDARVKLMELGLTEKAGYEDHRIKVGSTIDLAGRFARVRSIEHKHGELKDVAHKLRAMAGLLDELGSKVIVPPKDVA